MSVVPNTRMTVDDYLTWAEGRQGRYELIDGAVYAMSPERAIHAEVKAAVYTALAARIKQRRLPCHVLPDGMTVRVDAASAYEPDALVYCGDKLPPSALDVPEPVIVVEVLSMSTRHVDLGRKLAGYFTLPSIVHYLIVDPDQPLIIHHARRDGDTIATRIVRDGTISLDPPGLELTLTEIYAGGS